MHFLTATALCLSLVQHSKARIPHSFRQIAQRDAAPEADTGLLSWLGRVMKTSLQRRQAACYEDEYWEFVNNSTFGESFCQVYMKYPNTTTTVDFTPAITASSIVTTYIYTDSELTRTTPTVTITTTVTPAAQKRDALGAPAARLVKDAFALFNRQAMAANGTTANVNAMSVAFSSACACQTYSGAVVTATYTDEPTVVTTVKGFVRTTTTVFTTRTAGALTTTLTITASSTPSSTAAIATGAVSSSLVTLNTPYPVTGALASQLSAEAASSTTSSMSSVPTTAPFTCPNDNGTVVSQMVGNERFDYLVLCNYDLPFDPLFYGQLAYKSFSECVAACSKADANFDQPLCQAAVYFTSPNINGFNCLLKSGANSTTTAVGVDVAILQRIAVGLDTSSPSGTSTEALPFLAPSTSIPAAEVSAGMASIMNGSSTSMSMSLITPGPHFVAGGRAAEVAQVFTAFSTYVSGGSTFSTGSVFSTYYTSDGSWFFSYFSTYTVAWASASTVVAFGADSTAIASTNETTYYQQGGQNGQYVTVTNTSTTTFTYYSNETISNTTDTITYSTFAQNGSFITASTTFYNHAETQAVGEGNSGGGFNGGFGQAGSGPLSTVVVTSVSTGTQGGFGGAGSGGVLATPAPSISSTVVYNSGGTGGFFQTEGSGGITVTSTAQPVTSTIVSSYESTISEINQSFGTNGGGGGFGSGAITPGSSGFGSAFSTQASGAFPPSGSAPLSSSSTATDTGTFTNSDNPRVGTGGPSTDSTGYGSAFSTEGSGLITPSATVSLSSSTATDTGTFGNTENPRIGSGGPSTDSTGYGSAFSTQGSGLIPVGTAPLNTTSAIPTLSSAQGYVPPGPSTTSTPSGTAPLSPPGTSPSGTAPISPETASSDTTSSSNTSGARIGSGAPPTSTDTTDTATSSNTSGARIGSGSPPTSTGTSSEIPLFPTPSYPGYVPPQRTTSSSSSAMTSSSSLPGTAASGTAPPISIPPSGTSPTTDTTSSSNTSGARIGSGSPPSSTDTIPILPSSYPGYVPSFPYSPSTFPGTTGVSSVPSDTAPGTAPPSGTAPTSFSTSTATDTFGNNNGNRTGYQPYPPTDTESSSMPTMTGASSSSFISILVNATTDSFPSGTMPSGTMPTMPMDTASSSGFSNTPGNRTGFQTTSDMPSGTMPSGTMPLSTAPGTDVSTSSSGFSNTPGNRTGFQTTSDMPSGTMPSGTMPLSTAPGTDVSASSSGFSNTPGDRTGSQTTSEMPMSTGPVTIAPPPLASTCVNATMGTTTVFTTVTMYGCYSQCIPNQGGYYGGGGWSGAQHSNGPQQFGPPT